VVVVQHDRDPSFAFYARQHVMLRASRVLAIVEVSVRSSVTPWHCIKTATPKITKFLLWAAPSTLVFSDKILCLWVTGFFSNEGVKVGYRLKDVILPLLALRVWKWLQIDTDLLHIVTSTGDMLFRFVDIDYLERPWPPKRGVLVNIFLQFLAVAHISTVNCDEMARDRPKQPARKIFNIECRF